MSLAPVPDSPLDRLAREVRAEHEAADRAWESAVEHARRAGELLIEAKDLCKHGEWLPWLRDVGIPARTAQAYMKVARKYAESAHLPPTISDALDSLEDRERRAYQARMRDLSAKFDRVMAPPPPRPSYDAVQRYRDLMTENPDWGWSRVSAYVTEFVGVVRDMPRVPPTTRTAELLRDAIWYLQRALEDEYGAPEDDEDEYGAPEDDEDDDA